MYNTYSPLSNSNNEVTSDHSVKEHCDWHLNFKFNECTPTHYWWYRWIAWWNLDDWW